MYYFCIVVIDWVYQQRQELLAPACMWIVLCITNISVLCNSTTLHIYIILYYSHWLSLSTQAGAFSPCLCMYGVFRLFVYSVFILQLLTQSVCIWYILFPIFQYFVFVLFVYMLFLYYSYWLSLSIQAGAFGPCLCVNGTLHHQYFTALQFCYSVYLYYFCIIVIDGVCMCIVLWISTIWIFCSYVTIIDSICMQNILFPIFPYFAFLLFLHIIYVIFIL